MEITGWYEFQVFLWGYKYLKEKNYFNLINNKYLLAFEAAWYRVPKLKTFGS